MGDVVDLSVGAPSAPQVAGGVGDPVSEPTKPKRPGGRTSPPKNSSAPSTPAPPTGFDMLDEPLPAVTMDQVKVLVMGAGILLSTAFADADVDGHWRFTDAELAALVPPLTSIINRRPALQRAVRRGDEFTVALVLAGYAGRNVDQLRTAHKARAQRESEVKSGRQGETDGAAGPAGAGGTGAAGPSGGSDVPGGRVPRPAT